MLPSLCSEGGVTRFPLTAANTVTHTMLHKCPYITHSIALRERTRQTARLTASEKDHRDEQCKWLGRRNGLTTSSTDARHTDRL